MCKHAGGTGQLRSCTLGLTQQQRPPSGRLGLRPWGGWQVRHPQPACLQAHLYRAHWSGQRATCLENLR